MGKFIECSIFAMLVIIAVKLNENTENKISDMSLNR